MRVDDLDVARNREGAVESFMHDLNWLGLDWDGPVVLQSQRRGLYFSFLSSLRLQGRLYACRCTRRILSQQRQKNENQKIYPGTCRALGLEWGYKDGRLPGWRLRASKKFSNASGDVLLRRADGYIAYHLATVIDELTLGISEVIRGADLASSTTPQLAVMDALEQDPPGYKHVPLMLDSSGRKLAKRHDDNGLQSLMAKGVGAPEVIGLLASSLNLVPKGACLSAQDLLNDLKNSTIKKPLFSSSKAK